MPLHPSLGDKSKTPSQIIIKITLSFPEQELRADTALADMGISELNGIITIAFKMSREKMRSLLC